MDYKVVIPFRVTCTTGTLPHVALATVVVEFDRGDVSPYNVPTDTTGPGSIVVVCWCVVAFIGCVVKQWAL